MFCHNSQHSFNGNTKFDKLANNLCSFSLRMNEDIYFSLATCSILSFNILRPTLSMFKADLGAIVAKHDLKLKTKIKLHEINIA